MKEKMEEMEEEKEEEMFHYVETVEEARARAEEAEHKSADLRLALERAQAEATQWRGLVVRLADLRDANGRPPEAAQIALRALQGNFS